MARQVDFYVSYAHDNSQLVEVLVRDLQSVLMQLTGSRLEFWFDRHDIPAGGDLRSQLLAAIEGAEVMLAVISPSYLHSEWTKHEYEVFSRSGRAIVAVVLEEFRPNPDALEKLVGDRVCFRAPALHHREKDQDYWKFIKNLAANLLQTLRHSHRTASEPPAELAIQPPTQRAKGYVFLSYAEEDAD